jgi:capsular polysaccharide biosynthesis protein
LPETMSIADQIRMYQGASLVVAPNGSSLINAVFAPKNLKLLVLSQRGIFNWGTFYGLMRELDYDLTFFCSGQETDEKHADYSIDVPSLLAAIDSLAD